MITENAIVESVEKLEANIYLLNDNIFTFGTVYSGINYNCLNCKNLPILVKSMKNLLKLIAMKNIVFLFSAMVLIFFSCFKAVLSGETVLIFGRNKYTTTKKKKPRALNRKKRQISKLTQPFNYVAL